MKTQAPWRRLLGAAPLSPLRHWLGQLFARTSWTVWARIHTGAVLRVDLASPLGRSIWLRGAYEPEVERQIVRRLHPGDVFVDVGANVGYFSVVAAPLVGASGRVHALEPSRNVFGLLEATRARNRLDSLVCSEVAAWSATTTLGFEVKANSALSHLAPSVSGSATGGLVETMTLDDYLGGFDPVRVRLVKVDVEGAELHVLMGARCTLEEWGPVLVVEMQDWGLARFSHDMEMVFRYLQSFGYRAYDLSDRPVADPTAARAALAGQWVKNLVFTRETTGRARDERWR